MSARPWLEALVALTIAGIGLWWVGFDRLARAVALEQPEALGAPVLAACHLPAEHEQLHIVVLQRAGGFVAECMHVGSSGTYTRRPR
jgi:hypothetical protein